MQQIKGKVENIESKTVGVHVKSIVDIKGLGRERAYVEFRGENMIAELSAFTVGDKVEVIASLEGAMSKAGVRFNNLIAYSIVKSN